MKLLVALAGVLVLVGCGKAQPGLEFQGFEAHTEQTLRAAADDLFAQVKLDRRVTVVASSDGSDVGGHACVDCGDCRITVNTSLATGESMLKGVLWHEFGHCVGLGHTDERGVMFPSNVGFDAFTADQVGRFVDDVRARQ